MLTAVVLVWSLANACPAVDRYRSQGFTDEQIEVLAKENRVPAWVIKWARRHCRAS